MLFALSDYICKSDERESSEQGESRVSGSPESYEKYVTDLT